MDSETHYITFDPTAIWDEMIVNYVQAGGDILYPGDEKEMLLRSVQADIVQVLAGVDAALRMKTLRYAVGDYLDLYGEGRGCKRIQATPAKATVTITTNVTGRRDTIQSGTLMTADGDFYYALVNDLVLTGQAQTFNTVIVCDRAGSAGNALRKGAQMQMKGIYDGIRSIVVATDAAGGNEREEDDAYRERIREFGLSSTTAGTAGQYEAIAKAVSSKIVDVKAFNEGIAGYVTVAVLLEDGAALTILDQVYETLTDEKVRILTDIVQVRAATDLLYTINVKYESDGSGETVEKIAQAALDYQEWQDQTIGRAFNPDKLLAMLYQAGATRVIWDSGSGFNGGALQYTTIAKGARCKGTISLSAV